MKAEDIQARRGNIYDRKGREFAVNLELESLYCDAKEVVIDKGGVQELSSALGYRTRVLQAKFQPEQEIHLDGQKTFA